MIFFVCLFAGRLLGFTLVEKAFGKAFSFLMEGRVVAQFLPFFSGILDSVLLILVQVEDTFQFNNTS